MESVEIDDVRNDFRAHAVPREHCFEKSGRHDERGRAIDRRAHDARESMKEHRGLAAPVIDDGRHAASARNPDRRRRDEMPGPAGIGHYVSNVRSPERAPKMHGERHEPDERANAAQAPGKRGYVRGIGLHELDHRTLGGEQPRELLGLVGHPAGRRRQADRPGRCASPRTASPGVPEGFEHGTVTRDARWPAALALDEATSGLAHRGQSSRSASSRNSASASAGAAPARNSTPVSPSRISSR